MFLFIPIPPPLSLHVVPDNFWKLLWIWQTCFVMEQIIPFIPFSDTFFFQTRIWLCLLWTLSKWNTGMHKYLCINYICLLWCFFYYYGCYIIICIMLFTPFYQWKYCVFPECTFLWPQLNQLGLLNSSKAHALRVLVKYVNTKMKVTSWDGFWVELSNNKVGQKSRLPWLLCTLCLIVWGGQCPHISVEWLETTTYGQA